MQPPCDFADCRLKVVEPVVITLRARDMFQNEITVGGLANTISLSVRDSGNCWINPYLEEDRELVKDAECLAALVRRIADHSQRALPNPLAFLNMENSIKPRCLGERRVAPLGNPTFFSGTCACVPLNNLHPQAKSIGATFPSHKQNIS